MTTSFEHDPLAAVLAAEEAVTNPRGGPEFLGIAQARLDRRGFLRGLGSGAALSAFGLTGVSLSACGGGSGTASSASPAPARISALSFALVDKSRNDQLTVPTGYTARAFYRTGDPIGTPTSPAPAAYSNVGTDAASTYTQRAGDCHDGIEYYGLNDAGTAADYTGGNRRGVLAMNHEYIVSQFLHQQGDRDGAPGSAKTATEADREVALHGVSVVEVMRQTGGAFSATGTWDYNVTSTFNRRITALTRIEMSGPARGNPALITKYSPAGTHTRGTLNNCGSGYTFWGTYLTCEENWAGYFTRNTTTDNANRGGSTAKSVISLNRYGVTGDRYRWGTLAAPDAATMATNAVSDTGNDRFDRWNANLLALDRSLDYANAANTFGWVVEIDPYNPNATPKKRTALGRFAHEAAVMTKPAVGQPLAVYMGDDSRGDYIYKFVSQATWSAADVAPTSLSANRMALGDKYLDSGTLYAARFNADGTGTWLPLTITNPAIVAATNYTFSDQADVLINARLAGDAVGATRMDRPEWGAVNPLNNEIYFTLTENNSSGTTGRRGTTAGSGNVIDAANPRYFSDARSATSTTTAATNTGNPFGHIIRIREDANNPASLSFTWDVYLFGAQADADPTRVNLSGLSTANDFARADGLWFSDATNIAWIQTDDSGAFLDQTNCMMLAALPGSVAERRALTAQAPSTAVSGSTPVGAELAATFAGATVTASTLRRFLVGPRDCEITGVADTPDGRTMFVNVQHPGEDTAAANVVAAAGTAGAGDFNSYWPAAERAPGSTANINGPRPRSATVVITKDDGGQIGL
ncbi:PhoX family protein [Parvibium lacunae]|uniref:PhoX family protein n=1 Tax=Parvibium lacunae TaxID=1888893 RepID=UPI00131450D0|nr:PhoX family phosphatase [Parvibium lacunae]